MDIYNYQTTTTNENFNYDSDAVAADLEDFFLEDLVDLVEVGIYVSSALSFESSEVFDLALILANVSIFLDQRTIRLTNIPWTIPINFGLSRHSCNLRSSPVSLSQRTLMMVSIAAT